MNATKGNPIARRRAVPRASRERGYILLVLALFAALIAIGLMKVLPVAMVETQREREEELIFRGQQYQRAIQAFVRKFGRYPNSLEELEQTNQIRFLRRRFRDPMVKRDPETKPGEEWRLIHIGPGGVFTDAKTTTTLPTQGTAALNPSTPGGLGLPPSPAMQRPGGTSPSPAGSSGTGPTSMPSPFQPGPSPFGRVGAPVPSGQSSVTNPTGRGLTSGQGGLPPGLLPSANPAANPAQQPRAAAAAQQAAPLVIGGGGIAGVASQNTGESIKVWNGYSQYDEWEFIYDFRTDPIGTAAIARVSGVVAQPTLQPGAPAQQPTPTQQPTTQPGFPGTPFPSPFPGSPGSQPPGIRPGTPPGFPQFPPSPIPGTQPRPRQR